MSICTEVGSFIESKTTVVQTSNVGFTSEVSDYLVVHTGPDWAFYKIEAQVFAIGMDFFHFLCIKVMVLVYP